MLSEEMAMQNPWWTGGTVPDEWPGEFKRPGYAELLRHIGDHPAHAILGARQVGKTTLLYQLAARLVAGGDPKRVMVARLDEPGMFPSHDNLRRMLDMYSHRVLGESLYALSKRTYVPARRGPGRQELATGGQGDSRPARPNDVHRVGIVERGHIRQHRVAGREDAAPGHGADGLFRVPAVPKDPARRGARAASRRAARPLARSVRSRSARPFAECVEDSMAGLAPARRDLDVLLSEYLLYGGYPGVAAANGGARKTAELKTHVRLSMYSDIVKVGNIRNPEIIEQLFYMLAQKSPRLVNKDRMIRSLGINRRTLDAYLYLLKATYMVSYASQYAPSSLVRARAEKKVYVNDTGVRNAALSDRPTARWHARPRSG